MVNYQENSKIYRIINDEGLSYVGGTTDKALCKRLAYHRKMCREGKDDPKVQQILQGTNPRIVLVERVSVSNREDLNQQVEIHRQT